MYSFTPSTRLLDTHRSPAQALAEKNIDEVVISAVNDAAVMGAWAKAQDIDDNDKRPGAVWNSSQTHIGDAFVREGPAPPRHRTDGAWMTWRSTRRFSTNAP